MATVLVLKLTGKDAEFTEKEEPVIGSIRAAEILILIELLNFSASQESKISKLHECLDVVGRLKNLEDDRVEFTLSKDDVKMFERGLSVSAGINKITGMPIRPHTWYACTELWKQLSNLEEREVE